MVASTWATPVLSYRLPTCVTWRRVQYPALMCQETQLPSTKKYGDTFRRTRLAWTRSKADCIDWNPTMMARPMISNKNQGFPGSHKGRVFWLCKHAFRGRISRTMQIRLSVVQWAQSQKTLSTVIDKWNTRWGSIMLIFHQSVVTEDQDQHSWGAMEDCHPERPPMQFSSFRNHGKTIQVDIISQVSNATLESTCFASSMNRK